MTFSGGQREDRPNGWFTRLRAGGDCDGGWSPRTVAFTVDIVDEHRPLIAGRRVATAGYLDVEEVRFEEAPIGGFAD